LTSVFAFDCAATLITLLFQSVLLVLLKAKCSEEVVLRKREIDRLDLLIVHSPERATQEMAIMQEKVSH